MIPPKPRRGPEAGDAPPPAGAGADPDQPLLERIRDGDRAAYGALLDRHLPRIHGLASRLLGNAADAEDIGQETFLRAWQQIPAWRPGAARFSTWLHRVALNLCHDRLRRRRELPTIDTEPASGTAGPARRAREHDRATRVRVALGRLPRRQRDAIVLCHYQELGQREAAGVLEVSVEALESLLARGRRNLRATLLEGHDTTYGADDED